MKPVRTRKKEKSTSENLLAGLAVEAANIGTFQWEIGQPRFQYSKRLAEIFGLKSKNLKQKRFIQVIHPDDLAIRDEAHKTAYKTGHLFYEVRIVWPDRSIHWARLNGKVLFNKKKQPVKIFGAALDITTEKKEALRLTQAVEQNIKVAEYRYRKMIEEVQDYAIILLDENGNIQNWNNGAEKIKGYSARDIIGKNFQIFYTPEDKASGLPTQLLAHAAATGRATHEGWRVRKNGTQFWGSITITALHDERGNVIGFSKVTRDLTERKATEDRMLKYMSELEVQNRELEQFAFVASHDLQEPLRKIQTFVDLIKRSHEEADISKFLEKIQVSAERMSDLIKAVLNYSRLSKDSEQKTTIDLNHIVSQVKNDFELLIQEKNAEIQHEDLPLITGYPQQITQLFSNLLGNSLKFSKESPLIRISAKTISAADLQAQLELSLEKKYVEIKFTDNGIGFEQEYVERIFMMFQRLHGRQQYAGTGIGLAICKKIAELHHGFITAESELGKGATFNIYLAAN